MLVWDTSGLLALVDADDPRHSDVVGVADWRRPPGVLSPLVITEFDHLIRRKVGHRDGRSAVHAILTAGFETAALSTADVGRCLEVDQKYADLGLGLTDASLVLLAERYRTLDIVTLDERHFRAVTPLGSGRAFRVLPADL